jgi:transcription elongation factor GreA
MTATPGIASRSDALSDRLDELRRERVEALAEIAPTGSGDDADRATNVDAHVRLEMLERRIADVEYELAHGTPGGPSDDGSVTIGSLVTLDFGDGPERFLLGSVDHATDAQDVITPGSSLGRVLLGAKVGSAISYEARANVRLKAKLLAVA